MLVMEVYDCIMRAISARCHCHNVRAHRRVKHEGELLLFTHALAGKLRPWWRRELRANFGNLFSHQ